MSDNKDDYIQKNLEQALEVCGDSEFLQKQRSEYFSTENEKISVIDQSFPPVIQKNVITNSHPINQDKQVSNILLSHAQEMGLGKIQQETTILNTFSNNDSARKRFKKIFFELSLYLNNFDKRAVAI